MKANDMRQIILALALLYPAAVFAQTTPPPAPPANPPTVGDKPLVQVDSKKPKAAGKKSEAPAKPQSIAQKLQACQDIDDATKDRLRRRAVDLLQRLCRQDPETAEVSRKPTWPSAVAH